MHRDDLENQLAQLHASSFGWALGCCRHDRNQAEEVLQNVYVMILEGRARFDGRSSFKTWLFGVIRRTALSHGRRRWLRQLAVMRWIGVTSEPSSTEAAPDERLAASERARELVRALARLARRQREVLGLVFYHDMTIEETASALGISVGSARVHYHRGKKRLASLLAEGSSN